MFFTGEENEFSRRTETLALPCTPSFVVTKIIPFAPLAPKIDVVVASFNIEKLSISSGCNLARSSILSSTPSISIKGLLVRPNVVTPLTKNWALSSPGSPFLWQEISPAIRPERAVVRLLAGILNSDGFIEDMAPTTASFFCVPNPTTTTSSSCSISGTMVTLIVVWVPANISCFMYPINEKTRVASSGT